MGKIVYLSLGSNMGDRQELLQQAIDAIATKAGRITQVSSLYETPPWGFEADTSFLNLCLVLETSLSPTDLLATLNRIETTLGRSRHKGSGYQSRTIDIDIIDYNGEVHQSAALELPHPRYSERNFVLLPLAEIAPDFRDPKTGKPIQQIQALCLDESSVVLYESK